MIGAFIGLVIGLTTPIWLYPILDWCHDMIGRVE